MKFLFPQKNRSIQGVIQRAENTLPPQLAIINANIKNVFGEKYTSMFMRTNPSELLFTGIKLCSGNMTGLAKIICSIIKRQRPKAISLESDGSMKFSMFGFVSNFLRKLSCFFVC